MTTKKWGAWMLTAIVVGNMVGSGIFMLPASLARLASPLAVTLAWLLTGFGVLLIGLVFGNLAIRRPDLTAGPQSYASALFRNPRRGKVFGFIIAWGYWVANWSGNVAIITTFAGYLSTFFPIMKQTSVLFQIGSFPVETGKLITFLVCTIYLWGTHFILCRNTLVAGRLNFMATATKVIGFVFFMVAALSIFQWSMMGSFYYPMSEVGSTVEHGLLEQINLAAISTLWAFVGIESASILSARARSQRDVKIATILGLVIVVCIYVLITLLTMGVLPVEALRHSDKPLADALVAIMGPTGGIVLALLAIFSLMGTTIGWILVGSEVSYQAAQAGMFPKIFEKTNQHGSPAQALLITNLCTQIFVFSTISNTIAGAFTFVITVATLAYLIPYIVSALYQLKLVYTGETYRIGETRTRVLDGCVGILATLYSLWVIKTGIADLKTLLLGMGLFFSAILIYPFAFKKSA
ncbi:amino acid permease [Brevibacillus laterosporus]|uniref:amino acid permease n=1 Tax=Brevibacillus laterosporus TaxID=1465 RepID=UPI001127DC98|nr:amino acid permease [Brevibacillus laterosporus]MBG9804707.1 arginine:ornithine antiporter [Brevibacillus laterosporus]MED4762041.1 amino acid permease [Brevibacillus laterosporus]TPH23083.1 amino acid permease [Brevibacillus laterosporus]